LKEQSTADINNDVLFREDSLGRWTPRSIFFDSESDQIDRLLEGEFGQLIEPG